MPGSVYNFNVFHLAKVFKAIENFNVDEELKTGEIFFRVLTPNLFKPLF